jgi:hypothetical protein
MKYLKKFNESKSNLIEIVTNCFSDLIDNEDAEIIEEDSTESEVVLSIYLGSINTETPDIEEIINSGKKTYQTLNKVDLSIKRLKVMGDFSIESEFFGEELTLIIQEGEKRKEGFLIVYPDGKVSIDISELKEYLDFKYILDITKTSMLDGTKQYTLLKIKTGSSVMDKSKEVILDKILNYKLDGVPIVREVDYGQRKVKYFEETNERYNKSIKFILNPDINWNWGK